MNKVLIFLFIVSFGLSFGTGPTGLVTSELIQYQYHKANLKRMVEGRTKNSNYSFKIIKNEGATKVMVILGEALNRKYMSLYGYDENTSPNLRKIAADSLHGKLIYFSDVISADVTTVPSLRKVLTNINNKNNIPFEKSITILDIFQKAKFETFWISNQAPLGNYDTSTSVIAATADNVYFTVNSDSIKNIKKSFGKYYDGDLINIFKREISKNNQKQIFFIHLKGSHIKYTERYPKEFEIFSSKSTIENQYINSVLYNDWVVANLLKIGQENNFDVIFYFPDHGEHLEYGHNEINYKKEMSEIPFLVYISNNHIKKNFMLEKDLLDNIHTPMMTDNFFHDIQGITGVISSLYDPKESFITKSYIVNKRRVVNNKIPYDLHK